MIDVFVLFIATHGGWQPIAELPTEKACSLYEQQYDRMFDAQCVHLQRQDPFRPPTYKKYDGSISTQGR